MKISLEKIASTLDEAELGAKELQRFTAELPDFSISDGYKVQELILQKHLQRGAKLVGRKMGMTSKPKMIQMGISAPIHGFLTDRMQIRDGGELSLKGRIHPKIEPEVAFITGKDLKGKISIDEAFNAVSGITCALEIIDSRYQNFDFQLPDVVADNCSSSAFVLGSQLTKPNEIDNLGIILEVNGNAVGFGSSAAILGNPLRSLVDLVSILHEEEKVLPAGSIVLAGAATAAVTLNAGDLVRVQMEKLGSAQIKVTL